MNTKIVETLEVMCDKENPQDKKLLLLAELFESKCSALAKNQEEMKTTIENTNDKLDKLTSLLEKYEDNTLNCPVHKDRKEFEALSFFLKNLKIAALILLGILALMSGIFGSRISEIFDMLGL